MSTGTYLTYDEFLLMFDEEDILAVAGIGGHNSAAGRVIDQARVETVITRANSRIDGYVLSRFSALAGTPAANIPEALKGAAGDIVNYWLRDREGNRSTVGDVLRQRFEDALKYLSGIQSGKVDLGSDFVGGEITNKALGGISGNFPDSRSDDALDGYL